MFLSDRDIRFALMTGQLIVNPAPTEIDTIWLVIRLTASRHKHSQIPRSICG